MSGEGVKEVENDGGGGNRTKKEKKWLDWLNFELELLPNVPQSEPQQITLLLARIWENEETLNIMLCKSEVYGKC